MDYNDNALDEFYGKRNALDFNDSALDNNDNALDCNDNVLDEFYIKRNALDEFCTEL
ncbi:hypothetical protein A2U01_0069457 [Trifolium medium]|uniref:Uncharacterized protein n=1 Tax=Trifolium medium TaxID=97028 RepID=A0A392SJ27_9FABA|nr:hypothetical protein [Trifolium medium]